MFGEFTEPLAVVGAFCLSSYVWLVLVGLFGRRPRG
jgi:hypothetical protein